MFSYPLSYDMICLCHFLIVRSVFQGLCDCVYVSAEGAAASKTCDKSAIWWFGFHWQEFKSLRRIGNMLIWTIMWSVLWEGGAKSSLLWNEGVPSLQTTAFVRSFVAPSCPENLLKKRDKLFQRATLAWFSHLLVGILSIGKIGTFSILGEGNYHGSCN